MKKLLFVFPVIVLLAAGCSTSLSQPTTKQISTPTSVPSSTLTPTATNYDQCVKQGGEEGIVGLNGFCAIDGKTFPAPPLKIPAGEKQCGDVLCKQINGQWVPVDN
jgi:hypothetical protein